MTVTIYWTMFEEGNWRFLIAATEEGLCFTGSINEDEKELIAWTEKYLPDSRIVEGRGKLAPYYEQFLQYVNGQRQALDMSLHYNGTVFQKAVWEELKNIPFGEVTTYSGIAEAIGKPTAVRAVGTAIGANPVMVAIPCHRVIGKNGSLTGFRGGLELKKMLLKLEGSLS